MALTSTPSRPSSRPVQVERFGARTIVSLAPLLPRSGPFAQSVRRYARVAVPPRPDLRAIAGGPRPAYGAQPPHKSVWFQVRALPRPFARLAGPAAAPATRHPDP